MREAEDVRHRKLRGAEAAVPLEGVAVAPPRAATRDAWTLRKPTSRWMPEVGKPQGARVKSEVHATCIASSWDKGANRQLA